MDRFQVCAFIRSALLLCGGRRDAEPLPHFFQFGWRQSAKFGGKTFGGRAHGRIIGQIIVWVKRLRGAAALAEVPKTGAKMCLSAKVQCAADCLHALAQSSAD